MRPPRWFVRFERFVDAQWWWGPIIAAGLFVGVAAATFAGSRLVEGVCVSGVVAVIVLMFVLGGARCWLTGWLLFRELWRDGRIGLGALGAAIFFLPGALFIWVGVAGVVAFLTKYWGVRLF